MKKVATLLMLVLFPFSIIFAQGTDYVGKKEFQAETKKITEGIQSSKKSVNELKKTVTQQVFVIDSLQKVVDEQGIKTAALNDSINTATQKIVQLETGFTSRGQMLLNGLIILAILAILLIAAAFFYIRMVSVRNGGRIQELADNLAEFNMASEKEFATLRAALKETKEHVLFVSDELKEAVKKINSAMDGEHERSAMIDEKVKNLILESEINHKVNREKIIALQQGLEKTITEIDQKVQQVTTHVNAEILRISKIKPDKEKGELV